MNPIEKAGQDYIAKNISIIPVGRDKRPLIQWADNQATRATVADLTSWLSLYPDMQLGIVTGQISGIIVVDVDDPKMDLSWLPETTVIQTGSGGYHYYYAYTTGFSNKTRIRENIDIRADGGYVVAPPSYNLNGQYKVIKKGVCQPFPISLFVQTPIVNYTQIKTEYKGFGEGQRNDAMTKYIGHLLAKIHPSEWEQIAWRLATEANQKNTPPLTERELKTIFDSITGKERHTTTERWYRQAEKMDVRLAVKQNYNNRYTWGTRGLDTTLAVLKRGNFIIVGAKRGSGKTTFTFDMACKNALLFHRVLYISLEMEEQKIKEDFARKYAGITVQEEYDYTIPDYKQAAFERKMREIESIELLFFRGMRRGKSVTWVTVIEIINEFDDLDLIFIDNLDLIDGFIGENDTERQKRITKNIMGITAEKQIPIILIHHHRKSKGDDHGTDELAGSGKIADNADIIIKISKCHDPEAPYPDKYKTTIRQQKGRGYAEAIRNAYFIKGSFEDEAPPEDEYYTSNVIERINKANYFDD